MQKLPAPQRGELKRFYSQAEATRFGSERRNREALDGFWPKDENHLFSRVTTRQWLKQRQKRQRMFATHIPAKSFPMPPRFPTGAPPKGPAFCR